MAFHPRHEHLLPGWHRFDARCAIALERGLKEGGLYPDRPGPMAWQGSRDEAHPRKKIRLSPARVLKLLGLSLVYLHLGYIALTSCLILAYRDHNPSVTVLMAYRKWVDHWTIEAPRPLRADKIPAYIKSMLVAIEDDKFYEHHGIDPEAFKRAYEINSRLKRPLYGGSTLTMQVARTLFLVPVKSYVRKYFEVIAAFELELFLPKKRILELYFSYAEWGKGLFGMDAAARHYYGRGVAKLSRTEAAGLIALLSSPIRYKPATLGKSLILRERYAYLLGRYVGESPKPSEVQASPAPPPAPPPPSPPPHVDPVDLEGDQASPAPQATGNENRGLDP